MLNREICFYTIFIEILLYPFSFLFISQRLTTQHLTFNRLGTFFLLIIIVIIILRELQSIELLIHFYRPHFFKKLLLHHYYDLVLLCNRVRST